MSKDLLCLREQSSVLSQ